MNILYCTLHLTHNWESLLLRLQGIFEGTSEVLKRKNKTERYFSTEVEIFSEKGNSISSLYWINTKISPREPLSVSFCSEVPRLALSDESRRFLPYLAQAGAQSVSRACRSCSRAGEIGQQPPLRGEVIFPLFSNRNCHPRYSQPSLVSNGQALSWRHVKMTAGTWPQAAPPSLLLRARSWSWLRHFAWWCPVSPLIRCCFYGVP